ncbi:MAG: EAL domain-containing protein [Gammaproteobacteria bacterium]|nr:EAL domain-containing protein [Gammaproteobacteria bacterium]
MRATRTLQIAALGATLSSLVLCMPAWAGTEGSAEDSQPIVFEHLTSADGLPQSTVYATLQDSRGFLWIATQDGLARYDGAHMVRYQSIGSEREELPGNFIQALAEDAHGDVWVASADGGLARWDHARDRFRVFRHEPQRASLASNVVVALALDRAGHVWIGTRDAGVDVLAPQTGTFEHLRHDPKRTDSLIDDRVQSLTVAADGTVWVNTDSGLERIAGAAREVTHCPAALSRTNAANDTLQPIYVDGAGGLWQALSEAGFVLRDRMCRITARFEHDAADGASLGSDSVHAFLQDADGRMWVGTASGLDLFDRPNGHFRHYVHDDRDPGSLSDSDIVSLYQDGVGNLWIGTRLGGLSHWNPRSWRFGGHRPQWLHGRAVTSFADAGEGRVWVGAAGAGLARFDPRSGEHTALDALLRRPGSLGDERVMALEQDRAGRLWIGTMASGVHCLSSEGVLSHMPVNSANESLRHAGIMTLHVARDGRLWIGTHGQGAAIFAPRTGQLQSLPGDGAVHGLTSPNITAFADEPTGNVWIGTDSGGLDLADASGRLVRAFRHDPHDQASLPSDSVYAITIDRRSRVWVATDRGLALVKGASANPEGVHFERLSIEEGASSSAVWAVLPDARGGLWLSGNSGLVRLDPEARTTRHYHAPQGLQGEEFDFGAATVLADGRLAFGGPGGLNVFDPVSVETSAAMPRVALTRLDVLGAPLKAGRPYWLLDRAQLAADARIVSLEFAVLDFTSPAHNRLAYRLPTLSDRWIDVGASRQVVLTDLGAGEHVIEVRASTPDSAWSAAQRFVLHKRPPLWASLPAYAAYVGALLLLCLYVLRSRARRREQSARIERLAYFDTLTELPNRQRCLERAESMIASAKRQNDLVSFVYLDLDGFKRINDTFGHSLGDGVLKTVAQRLSGAIAGLRQPHEEVLVSRFGGDEFVVLARHAPSRNFGHEIAAACHAVLAIPVNHQNLEFLAKPSVGIATYPRDGTDTESLLKHADTAMYQAKGTGAGGIVVYDQSMSSRLERYVQLESRLRRAIAAGELGFALQPKYRLRDRELVGAEVLTRWHDEELGDVAPDDFIAVAEESSLIIGLGEWVIHAACHQLRAWHQEGLSLPLAINVSAKELLHGDPARILEFEARTAGIPASLIEIEITESLLVRESPVVRAALERLRALGCAIALDDFGTGYSSLGYLTRFRPDRIKIDKTFVRRVDHSPIDSAVAAAILSVAGSLRISATAEGIEREAQLTWLREHGCQEGQGFLLSPPRLPLILAQELRQCRSALRAGVAGGSREIA